MGGLDGGAGAGAGAEGPVDDGDPDAPLSVFEVPNAMLGVDVRLQPGETKSWTYTVPLPEWLPPTYKGRAVKFAYQLAVGACRALPGPGSGSNSRVMKVPIRVYNHVSVERSHKPYDLMRRVESGVSKLDERDAKASSAGTPLSPSVLPGKGSVADLRAYARRLLSPSSPLSREHEEDAEAKGGALSGCREAVELLTRVPRRVAYDVHKDGVQVAALTFTKAAWRLGETVAGVVEINGRRGRARVLKVGLPLFVKTHRRRRRRFCFYGRAHATLRGRAQLSAYLEAHETLPGTLATDGGTPLESRFRRRVHAEHHASQLACALRTTFALDIPSDAAPAFALAMEEDAPAGLGPHTQTQTRAEGGGVEWRVRVCLLVAVAPEGARVRGMERVGERGEWARAWVPSSGPTFRRPPLAPPAGPVPPAGGGGWASFFTAAFAAPDKGYHDGDEDEEEEEEEEEEGEEEGWEETRAEMVECEVPV
ncbi:Rgp1-domain-containing protein, partial [Amylostereum chailletii]